MIALVAGPCLFQLISFGTNSVSYITLQIAKFNLLAYIYNSYIGVFESNLGHG